MPPCCPTVRSSPTAGTTASRCSGTRPYPGTFTNLPLPADFFCSGLTLLRGGKLFLAGGHAGVDNFGLKSAYQFNQGTKQWTRLADMRNGRWYPTLVTMGNGQILAISGGDTAAALNRIPEVFNPGQNTWRALTGAARDVPYYPMMFLAPDGKIFLAGPDQGTAFLGTSGAGKWTTGPTRLFGYRDYGSAVMYDAGKILVVGGGSPTASAEMIDLLGLRTWTPAGAMSIARRQINATLLADGSVLVTGGTNASGFNSAPTSSAVLAAELWNPASPVEWKKLASMSHYRLYHTTALLLPDGRVLVAGSGEPAASGLTDDLTAEIFSPPYLFNADGTPAARPVISSVPAKLTYGAAIHDHDGKRGRYQQGAAGSPFRRHPRDQHEPARRRAELLRRDGLAHGDRARQQQAGSAGALHAVHREFQRGAVGRQDRTVPLSAIGA